MKLPVPKEPTEVKDWIRKIEGMTDKSGRINWDSLNVWYGNKLPQYLWGEWKDTLKPKGFTWQKFLKLLGHRTDAVLLWYKGSYTWEEFVRETIKLIEGPLGQDIVRH